MMVNENEFRRNVIAYKIEYSCKVLLKMEAFTCVSCFAVILKEMKCNGNPRWRFFIVAFTRWDRKKYWKALIRVCVYIVNSTKKTGQIFLPQLLIFWIQGFNTKLGHAFFHYQLLLDDFFYAGYNSI